MVDALANPKQFKAELKDKWLDYFQANRNWLQQFMDEHKFWVVYIECEEDKEDLKNDYSPRRPDARFILGVISVLEPKVQGFLPYTIHLNIDPNCIVQALELNFDPELELKKRQAELTEKQIKIDSENLDRIREEIKT